MPIPPRQDIVAAGEYYHLYARGNRQSPTFLDESDFNHYLFLLGAAKDKFKVSIHHFMLMTNHVHLVVRCGDLGLSRFMHAVQLAYSKYFSEKYRMKGRLWQGRFKSEHIDSDAYMTVCGNYVELNPVRANMVANPEEWRYTSYRHYAFGEIESLVEDDPLYESLGRTVAERQTAYRRQVMSVQAVNKRSLPQLANEFSRKKVAAT